MMKSALSIGFVFLVAGCGAEHADGFTKAKSAGDRAYSAGRFDEAAQAYHHAEDETTKPHDREQAMFLEASTLERADRTKEAMAAWEALVAAYPKGDHTARAAYQRAQLDIEKGDAARGWTLLEDMLFRYPVEGIGRDALAKVQAHHEELAAGGGLAFLQAAEPRLATSEIGEDVTYRKAHALADAGRNQEAHDAFVSCAEHHPYPLGTLNDDAWWNASLLDEKLGNRDAAIHDLERLLAPREKSALGQGSYERPRYSPAALRIGVLYRDVLHDDAKARAAFHRVYTDFPTSILRAEALFNEGALAKQDHDGKGACNAASTLTSAFPESRYAGCASHMCPTVSDSPKAPKCRAYLSAQLGEQPPPDTDTLPDEPTAN